MSGRPDRHSLFANLLTTKTLVPYIFLSEYGRYPGFELDLRTFAGDLLEAGTANVVSEEG